MDPNISENIIEQKLVSKLTSLMSDDEDDNNNKGLD